MAEGSNDNFGYEISWEFGNCGGGNSGENDGGGGNCAPLRLDMVTDDWGGEISMYLTDLYSQEMLWSNFDFGSNKYYIYEECMDPDGCTELEIWDSHGDG